MRTTCSGDSETEMSFSPGRCETKGHRSAKILKLTKNSLPYESPFWNDDNVLPSLDASPYNGQSGLSSDSLSSAGGPPLNTEARIGIPYI